MCVALLRWLQTFHVLNCLRLNECVSVNNVEDERYHSFDGEHLAENYTSTFVPLNLSRAPW